MRIGYARVSTGHQDLSAQIDALETYQVDKLFREKESGGKWERPELQRLLEFVREGDVLVVWKLDRLSRSLKDHLGIMERLEKTGVGFVSLTESIETTSPAGRMLLGILGAFGEFERSMNRERTKAGLANARKIGKKLGRPSKISPEAKKEIEAMLKSGEKTKSEIARIYGVHPSTISKMF